MVGCGVADSRGRRSFSLLRVSHLLPDHLQVRLAEDQPCAGRRGHRRPADGLHGPRHGAVRHAPPGSRRWTLVRQAEEVTRLFLDFKCSHQCLSLQESFVNINKRRRLTDCIQTRREWQMERAFQTALWLLRPEIVFILGDIFDEGKWSSQKVTMSSYSPPFYPFCTFTASVMVGDSVDAEQRPVLLEHHPHHPHLPPSGPRGCRFRGKQQQQLQPLSPPRYIHDAPGTKHPPGFSYVSIVGLSTGIHQARNK